MPSVEPTLWRSLEERAGSPDFRAWLEREFPPLASEWTNEVSRRHFLKLMGASFALAGLGACTKQPQEKIVPYVQQPELVVPGKALHFASAMTLGGCARGVIVESHEGRPTKIEGNPNHPASLGATDVFMQAALLDLYDPDRAQNVLNAGAIRTWEDFLGDAQTVLASQTESGGAGLRILTQTVTSPTLHEQLQAVLAKFPAAQWHQWEPVNRDNVREGARQAFGEIVDPLYHFDKADAIVSLDADFLGAGPAQVRQARDFAQGRRVAGGAKKMSRLHVAESTPTITGAMADSRIPAPPSAIRHLAQAIAHELQVVSEQLEFVYDAAFVSTAADDLRAHRGASLIIAGDEQPAQVHELAHRINAALGNVGHTVAYVIPAEPNPINQLQSLRELAGDMITGRVEVLLIIGGNPAFDGPVDFEFARALEKVKWSAHLGVAANETAALCRWHLPEAHWLESWGDARAFDGTASIVQPLIEPLYGGKSAHELLATVLGAVNPSSYEIVRDYWRRHGLDDDLWRANLRDGVIANSSSEARTMNLSAPAAAPKNSAKLSPAESTLELIFRADASVYDGRFANNAWLQELPRSLTKLTWDNAALVSPETARQLDWQTGDEIELQIATHTLLAPVLILPGQADSVLTLPLGYGRTKAGNVGNGVGANAYALRSSEALDHASGVRFRKTGQKHVFAQTQHHHSVEGRNLLRTAALGDFLAQPEMIRAMGHDPARDETLYRPDEHINKRYAWAMSIDLSTCIGCNVCTIACVAENNIPVVGKEQVISGREMHWIRVDRYYDGPSENPRTLFQPVPCMHCENAPCELVCPVGATLHDSEGLNVQVYNRCIGTRYCSNNCPYKVRRFNFLAYDAGEYESPRVRKLSRNPDVTVRSRGVMEKCTYCVQRISAARIEADKADREIRDGEVVPACAQACPTEAIVFGDLNDSQSRVVKLKASPLNYAMLGELNTRPRTTYLARLTNA